MNRQAIETMLAPVVTVVLQLREEAARLDSTLRALAVAQKDAPPFEVLLMLNTRPIDAHAAARGACDRYPLAVRIIEEPAEHVWRVRNRAIDECLTEWIAFRHDETVPVCTWLTELGHVVEAGSRLPASDSLYDMKVFDAGLRFEPWADEARTSGVSSLANAIRQARPAHDDDETATLRHDWARTALALGRLDEAWAIFDSLGEHPEYGAQASLYAGDFALRDRLWLNAERCFQKCLEHRPDWNVAIERLTALLIQRANATANVHKKASLQRAALNKVQSVARPSELQLYQRASLEAAVGSHDVARRLFQRLTAAPAFQVGAWFHLGEIALADHDSTRAVQAFQHCLKLQPTHRKAISRLTSLLLDARVSSTVNVRPVGGAA